MNLSLTLTFMATLFATNATHSLAEGTRRAASISAAAAEGNRRDLIYEELFNWFFNQNRTVHGAGAGDTAKSEMIEEASPSRSPTKKPTLPPSLPPSRSPTKKPTLPPSLPPSRSPTKKPTLPPSLPPSRSPTKKPTLPPSLPPSRSPTKNPTEPLTPAKEVSDLSELMLEKDGVDDEAISKLLAIIASAKTEADQVDATYETSLESQDQDGNFKEVLSQIFGIDFFSMSRGVMNPGLVMRDIIPMVMAGVLGIYGLIVAVIIQGSIVAPQNGLSQYSLYTGFAHLAAGLCSGLAAGMAIGIVGDAGVSLLVILILIFAEALGLYGLIVSLILSVIMVDDTEAHLSLTSIEGVEMGDIAKQIDLLVGGFVEKYMSGESNAAESIDGDDIDSIIQELGLLMTDGADAETYMSGESNEAESSQVVASKLESVTYSAAMILPPPSGLSFVISSLFVAFFISF